MKTLFVLGAGANIELDAHGAMPIGAELANRIQSQILTELRTEGRFSEGPISSVFASYGGLGSEQMQAMSRIEQGIIYRDSIDEFLDEWSDMPEMLRVGKTAIAFQILEAESRTRLCNGLSDSALAVTAMAEIRDSWLGQILRYANLHARRRDVRECLANIGFITFNYDRCLETALYLFCRFGQGLDHDSAKDVVESIPIIHAYGSLGSIFESSDDHVPFGMCESWYINRSAGKIRTFTEEKDDEHSWLVRRTVNMSEKIVFLGFGYHPQNLELLFPITLENRPVYGTAYKMRPRQVNAAMTFFRKRDASWSHFDCECNVLLDSQRENLLP